MGQVGTWARRSCDPAGAMVAGPPVSGVNVRAMLPGQPPPCERCGWAVPSLFALAARAASSSNSGASLSTRRNAPSGQFRHAPRPSQYTSLTSLALPSIMASAPSAQSSTHCPQPLHFSSSISMIGRFILCLLCQARQRLGRVDDMVGLSCAQFVRAAKSPGHAD